MFIFYDPSKSSINTHTTEKLMETGSECISASVQLYRWVDFVKWVVGSSSTMKSLRNVCLGDKIFVP